ncbi:MAG: methyltransferase, partial [Salinirussus sp.]
MPVRPNALERLLLYRFNRGPAPIVDLFAAAGFRAVALAIDLGLFAALDDGKATPSAIADAVDAHPDGVHHLLALLEPLGYVERSGDGYAPSRMTSAWLLGDDPNLAPWFTYWSDVVFPYWTEHLETTIRSGSPERTAYDYAEENELWEVTQRGFRAVATLLADDVFETISLP